MTIQVGVCAMRDPKTGAFLEPTAIFEETDREHTERYEAMMRRAGSLFGEWMSEHNG